MEAQPPQGGLTERVKDTGKIVAHYRRYSDIPYCSEIADMIDARAATVDIMGEKGTEASAWWLAPLFESRYKTVNQQLCRFPGKDVWEVAAGYAPRSLDLTVDPSVNYVDSDQDGVIGPREAFVRSILEREGLTRRNIRFEKVDVLNTQDVRRVAASFEGRPFKFVQEGLWPYFSLPKKQQMLACMHDVMPQGSVWVNADVMDRSALVEGMKRSPERAAILQAMYGATGEDFVANAFPSVKDAMDTCYAAGFDVEPLPRYDGSYPLSCAAQLKIDLSKITPLLNSKGVFVMRPR